MSLKYFAHASRQKARRMVTYMSYDCRNTTRPRTKRNIPSWKGPGDKFVVHDVIIFIHTYFSILTN